MIQLERLLQVKDIQERIKKDDIAKTFLDDLDPEQYLPDIINSIWFKVLHNNIEIGFIFIRQVSNNCLSIHGAMYKEFRSVNTPKYFNEILKILRKDQDYVFVTQAHSKNIAVQKMLIKAGFHLKATIKNAYKDGDMLLYTEA